MENIFGSVSQSIKERVINYLANSTCDNWDEIKSIIINKDLTTIWEAVINSNPSFPKQGKTYDEKDNIIKEWTEIPLPIDVIRAIKNELN